MNLQEASQNESKKIINALRAKRRRSESPLSIMLNEGNVHNLNQNYMESDNHDYFKESKDQNYMESDNHDYIEDPIDVMKISMREEYVNSDTQSAESTCTQLTSTSSCPSTLNILQLILGEIQKLNKNVQAVSKRIDKLEAHNTRIQTRLLAEIIAQRKLAAGNKPRMLLPPKPFQKIEDIDKFEKDLNNSSELCEQLEAELLNYKIADPAKFVRTILKKIFSDEAATKYSWKGTAAKKCIIGMAITTTLKGAFNKKYSVDEKKFSTICIKWFQTANDRIKYHKKA